MDRYEDMSREQLIETLRSLQAQSLLQENRRITQRLFEVQEVEDQRLARELHDELGQWLTAIQADAQTICNLSEQRCQAVYTSARAITEAVAQIQDVIRRIVYRLRVGWMHEVGLVESIREQVGLWKNRHSEIHTELTLAGDLDDLGETVNVAIYRMVQECLINVARHAQAGRLAIGLRRVRGRDRKPDKLILTVTDDGKGMDMANHREGFGLLGMRERALAAGGTFTLNSRPGQGMRISVSLPIPGQEG